MYGQSSTTKPNLGLHCERRNPVADVSQHPDWQHSDAYEAFMGRWSQPAAVAVVRALGIPSGQAWLDVGCGTGALSSAILTHAHPRELLGIDPSAEFLAIAANRIRDPRARFELGRVEALPVQGGHFDVAIAGLVLLFVPDPLAAVAEMARAVRSGGIVISYLWDLDDERQFTRPFWAAARSLDPEAGAWDPRSTHSISRPESLHATFEGAGLRAVVVEGVELPAVFRNFDDYWQPCLLDGPTPVQRYVRSLDIDRRDALRWRLQEILPVAADGSISLIGRLWLARGANAG